MQEYTGSRLITVLVKYQVWRLKLPLLGSRCIICGGLDILGLDIINSHSLFNLQLLKDQFKIISISQSKWSI